MLMNPLLAGTDPLLQLTTGVFTPVPAGDR